MARKPSTVQLRIMREMANGAVLKELSNLCALGDEEAVYTVTVHAMRGNGLIKEDGFVALRSGGRATKYRLTEAGHTYLSLAARKTEGE